MTLSVLDDGIGFDPAARTTGFGLLGMLERVMLVGGTLTVDPTGAGVKLEATFPMAAAQPSSNKRSNA